MDEMLTDVDNCIKCPRHAQTKYKRAIKFVGVEV